MRSQSITEPVCLTLLGGFQARRGDVVIELPWSVQRLVAFLALGAQPLRRVHVAASLWLDVPEERAHASLRTALWRLRRPDLAIVDGSGGCLALAAGVEVDVHETTALADRALAGAAADALPPRALQRLRSARDVLPDWYEDWVLFARERHRQLRLHALEALCQTLTDAGRFGEAAAAGSAAVADEPLRESAHRALMCVHIAEGNLAEALRQYRLFRDLLREQLGLEPSPRMAALLAQIGDGAVTLVA
jgi:DNA-binding SARP family transcriptional activator